MPHSFGRAIDNAIRDFRQQLAAERKMLIEEMQREIIGPLQRAAAESRDLAQLRLETRQTRLRKETTNSPEIEHALPEPPRPVSRDR